jgi:hypothetical protein
MESTRGLLARTTFIYYSPVSQSQTAVPIEVPTVIINKLVSNDSECFKEERFYFKLYITFSNEVNKGFIVTI